MPELPEVQTVVNYLNKNNYVGKNIHSIESPNGYELVCNKSSLSKFQSFLQQKQITSIWRRGKFIIIELNIGFLLFHLRMTGQLIHKLQNKSELKYVSLQINFQDGASLFFRDTRKFGKAYISNNLHWLEEKLGMEPLSKQFTPSWLHYLFIKHNRMIKPLLLDQQFIVGLGNIYIDEALWEAKIHPKSICSKINKEKTYNLCNAIKNILSNALQYNGTTIIDFKYGDNKKGGFKNELKVFQREDKPCMRCQSFITKIFVSQRGTHYCKKCQRI